MSSSADALQVLPSVAQSAFDPRAYRSLQLPNGLSVLLVSDPNSEKAAAAMDVGVGSSSDPENLPGLAHFVEHMLFLGTERYPKEDSYTQYLAENGGFCNAYTAPEHTNFQFQLLAADHTDDHSPRTGTTTTTTTNLFHALSMFSQFFTAPLFTESATERELLAVHSEHEKNIQDDHRRLYQLRKSTANPQHPFHNFPTGSKDTLRPAPGHPSDSLPDTRQELLNFHDKYYSANRMHLCIIAPYPLDALQDWTVQLFSDIPNKNIPDPSDSYKNILPFTQNEMARVCYSVPIKDVRLLELCWLIPPVRASYKSKPAEYLAHLIGHESKGSLLSLLKQKGWADSLAAMCTSDESAFSLFQVLIELTADGVPHVEDVVTMVFGYLRLIREFGVQKWIHEEQAALADLEFRYAEPMEPFYAVQMLSSQMSIYPPSEWLTGPHLIQEYDPKSIEHLLGLMTVDRLNVAIVGKFVEGTTDQTEKWYGTAYRLDIMPDSMKSAWENPITDKNLRIPKKNIFIPQDLSLVAEPLPCTENDLEGPSVLLSNSHIQLHYKLDRTFNRPKASVRMKFVCPTAYSSPRNAVFSNLFAMLLEDSISEFAYDASLAELKYSIRHTCYGIELALDGYNDRLNILSSIILEKMSSFRASAERFGYIRDQLERDHANFEKDQPYEHAVYNIAYMIEDPRWHVSEYLQCLRDGSVSMDSLNSFLPLLLSRMFVVVLVHGNVEAEWAKNMGQSVTKNLRYEPVFPTEIPRRRICQLPTEHVVVRRMRGLNIEDRNSAAEILYQVGPRGDFRVDVSLELLAKIMNKHFFHELRTKQQLGYMVFEGVDDHESVRGIYAIVQSSVVDPEELCKRIDEFMDSFRASTLESLSEIEFSSFVRSCVTLKMERDKTMTSRTSRFWREIVSEESMFGRAQREIEALSTVQKRDVVELFDRCISSKSKERRTVRSLVYNSDHMKEDVVVPDGMRVVHDPLAFRLSCPLFPVRGRRKVFEDQASR